MTIKWRLRISYIAMLIIPCILMLIGGWLLSEVLDYGGNYELLENHNPLEKTLDISQQMLGVINRQILEDPDQLANQDYIKQLESGVALSNAGMIIRKDDEIIHVPEFLEERKNEITLLPFKGEGIQGESILGNPKEMIQMRLYDFYFSDSSEGSVYLVVNTLPLRAGLLKLRKLFTIFSLLALGLTNGILTILVYRSIITPLKELQYASNEIREGNLDYTIDNHFHDEFGEAIKSFEGMRGKLKESLESQQQYEENRKILISNISHDLKTPITSIKGYIEGIKDGVADTPEKMDKYIGTIYKKAEDMDHLIENLFLLSKLDLQKLPFDFKVFDIVGYLKDIGEELNFDLKKKQIQLSLKLPEENIMINADGNNLRRVITNVVDNCIKYADRTPIEIHLTLKNRKEDVLVEIQDNGRGISKEALPHIFDDFYRADPSRNANTVGSGLGLAIFKKIIEEHDGTVWIESEVNQGTRVYFTLPKYAREEQTDEKDIDSRR
ncbi:integral membrane sensor signal transduction histidine kinase [Alkaliphilus metalliredigens QYMF]|uniref:histidine kinase n=1 Tax=Alkaliphilus metalliredigens (strain QYMF) TaxID=293826 RepID=A6TL12_ALKMQ|nr:HAMP domain-containing sensor histidine kinase [Alkaliphilus metalliredigens]ABR46880.1 integral membrane sensor signal transduction histidine kinase [Alkaliphilus metalliredigens QYMF]